MAVPLFKKRLFRLIVCPLIALTGSQVLALDCGSAPIPYQAHYSVTRKDKLAGSMQVVLKHISDGSYDYRMNSRMKWGFVHPWIQQQSSFTWKNGLVLPDSFRAARKVAFYQRTESVDFNWKSKRATGNKRHEDFELDIEPGMQDKLSIYLLLAQALCNGEEIINAEIVSGPVLKPNSYHLQAREYLDTRLGRLATIHIRQGTADTEEQTDLWHAEAAHFLPVRIVHRDKDDVIDMNLTDISFNWFKKRTASD
jgi:hypothetical protein